ncbi:MAG: response regulator [Schwartzia sp.]|nr:response regulator [Schwartzia sp. (in: firmicutes)]
MIQQQFKAYQDVELDTALNAIRTSPAYKEAASIYVAINTVKISRERAERIGARVRKALPRAVVTGLAVYDSKFNLGSRESINLNVNFFRESQVETLEYPADTDFETLGQTLAPELARKEDLKGIYVIYGGPGAELTAFLEGMTRGNESVPVFGLVSSFTDNDTAHTLCNCRGVFMESNNKNKQYLQGMKVFGNGLVLVLFRGPNLHIFADYTFGWTPLGREFTITKVINGRIVEEIDGSPATKIYQNYLGVPTDEYFLQNICEFPFSLMRNGMVIPRVPPLYDDEGRLYFISDMYEGEKIRLSYGNPSKILLQTWDLSEKMREFAPESLELIACGNRAVFLKGQFPMEIEMFHRYFPRSSDKLSPAPSQALPNMAQSEIFCHQGRGGVFNSVLVAIGMREGEGNPFPPTECPVAAGAQSHVIPLSERLAAFVERSAQDITHYAREAEAMAKEANAANEAKSQFLSNMSHEIRTPINAILGMNEMILRESTEPEILKYAENVHIASTTLLELVNDILDFSKIEAGKMDIIPGEYETASLLNDLVNMIKSRAEKKGLTLQVNASEKLPIRLYGDEVRIKQVATNILTNAVKYTEKGSVTLTVDFSPLDDSHIALRFAVKDTGIGIKEEDRPKLFAAFERIEESRNRAIEGTGLGMNITIRLLALMNSHLDVESVYGEGSTFSFAIRQQVVDSAPIGRLDESYRRLTGQHQNSRTSFIAPEAVVLAVDDTPVNLTVIKGLLKRTQVQVETAESGPACLAMAAEKPYDIIFLDHSMPGMDGIETLARLRQEEGPNRATPTVCLTANAIAGAREEYLSSGFTDYLTKPIDSVKLEKMMVKYLPPALVKTPEPEPGRRPDSTSPAEEGPAELPAWLLNLRGLDTAKGIGYCGSPGDYLETLKVFYETIEPNLREIEGFFRSKNWKDYTTKVHALKSSARIIGASELSDRAARLEDAGNKGYIAEIEKDTPTLLSLYQSYLESLSPLKATEKADQPVAERPEIPADRLLEAYETIKEMALSFDYDSVQFVLSSLEEYQIPPAEADRYEKIRVAAQKPDWAALQALL